MLGRELISTQRLIEGIIDSHIPNRSFLQKAMRYAALPTGKCLRAHLFIKSAYTFGITDSKKVAQIAAAIELIHSYSLVHDDLPALDNDNMRRGKPSCHIAFDEATAILAGNLLLNLGFKIIAEQLPTALLPAIKLVDIMIQGQSLDLLSQDNIDTNFQKIIEIYKMKTGSMFAIATTLGGRIANCSERELSHLEEFGYKIGIAFQIIDDVKDKSNIVKIIGKEHMISYVQEMIDSVKLTLKPLLANDLVEYIEFILGSKEH